jgi:uncharacterized protein
MVALGQAYANGRGIAKDDAEALRWLRKAAQMGNAAAFTNLGVFYETGRGGVTRTTPRP